MRAAGLSEAALDRLVCPIGVPGLESKDPAVIAASTAAQLLIVREKLGAEDKGRGAKPPAEGRPTERRSEGVFHGKRKTLIRDNPSQDEI